jgi:hypothetical protein
VLQFIACALKRHAPRLPSRNEVVDFRLQAGHFLVNSDKKVTKEAPPRSRRPSSQKAKSAMRGTLRFSLVAGSADRPSLA